LNKAGRQFSSSETLEALSLAEVFLAKLKFTKNTMLQRVSPNDPSYGDVRVKR
jgi:hypothetical protein